MQFPTVIGGVIPVVNITGIKPGELKLNGQVLGDIYLGKITKWNDPAIKALNGSLALPDAAIAPVRRADGSGTSFLFTNYLSKVNAEWKSKVGEGTAVNWPTGAGGKGNEGVAAFVNRLPNSIGYVEYAYVKQNKMTYAQLQNAAGTFVSPDDSAFKAAAAGADWNKSFYQVLTNQPARRLAHHRRHLHPDAQGAGQARQRDHRAEVLRLGLQERRQDGRRPRLRADARRREGHHRQGMGRREGRVGQGRRVQVIQPSVQTARP
jgi:ABC-type phosphate transport system substrate-binding protein